ncbi:BspA family leucine-rich repeat surface protein [Aequorivita sp. H23M31]|uniref:BspA family leucine-rich repeat surface protein n=1 Tax=Aequorivita ciconiae TaxID=2494375 RepID=A0A410FZK6_9FLAO|nr:BspA family leucine-rich repeat surface protein [Aequorivita sp. H23M31]QAA80457.1 BspA family leucine-rich repeat surface protein [Aequorivita sp. H23M31]
MRTLYIALLLLFAFATTSAQTLTQFEYYFDTEPGIGNGTAVTANANTGELSQTLSIPLTGLAEGFHKVVVRAKDDNNVWSMYSITNFYISDFGEVRTVPNLAAAEYFFGVDPGIGNGTALAVPANTGEVNTTFAIPLGNLPTGFHAITLRAKDTDGTWGLYSTARFYISDFIADEVKDVVALEYWFDTDPGVGNATGISVTPSQMINQVIPIPLNDLSIGFHKIGIRVKNADGTWSLYDQKLFYINEEYIVSPLSDAEFLFDAEFGFGTGTSAVLTPTGNPDEFTVEIPTDLINCGVHDLSLSVKNSEGKYSLYKIAENIDVFDDLPPTIVAQDITVQLDNSGTASITVEDVDNGTYDDCQLASLVLDITEFSCANLGENTVTLTATDAEGNVSTGTAIVTVEDVIAPSVFVQNISVDLDATGTATISAEDIDNGTFDNCTIASISIDIDTFSCSNIGANTVNFTAEDQSGNSTTVSFTVTVTDPLGSCIQVPVAVCQPLAINSNNNCQANATAQAFDGGSYDPNGLPLTYTVDPVGPYNVGITNVTLTVSNGTDSDSCTTTITVVDNTPPVANCVAPFAVQLDANGQASISVADIDNGSSDNCGIASASIDVTDFSCGDIGENTVTLTVTDISGHVSTCSTVVTVFDPFGACNEAPTAVCQAVTVSTEANCEGSAIAQDFDRGSTDPHGNPLTFTVNPMGPYPLGITQVTLTVSNGTSSDSCTTTITVIDNTAPVVSCAAPFTVQLDSNGSASITVSDIDNGSSDNCGIASMAIDKDSFDCSDIGENTIILTVTDSSGNVSTCTTVVTVEDSLSPIASCAVPFTLQLDANGSASIAVSDIDNGSSDNCGIASMAIDKDYFDCSDIGENTITLTVTDSSGNVSTCTTFVTVEDNIVPTVFTRDITVQLDANGNASITAMDIDDGSSDNCSIASLEIDKDTFNCSNVGAYTVTLTVTDVHGNSSSATATVTVEDPLETCDGVVPTDNFVTTWKTTMPNETITIPTTGSGYNYSVDWGDGNSDAGKTGNASHIYATPGIYTVSISGNFPRIYFNNGGDRLKIRSIEQWGNIQWSSMNSAFAGAENLVSHATDMPDLSMVNDMYGMFAYCRKFNGDANFGNWNVSTVTNMEAMFGEPLFLIILSVVGTWPT